MEEKPKIEILVVEDSATQAERLTHVLEQHEIEIARPPDHGFAFGRECRQHKRGARP